MEIDREGYFNRTEVSNSDIGGYKSIIRGYVPYTPERVFRIGKIVDAMLTDSPVPTDLTYSEARQCVAICEAFLSDATNRYVSENFRSQVAFVAEVELENGYTIMGRCLTDFYSSELNAVTDLKTTASTNKSEWDKAVLKYGYHRAAAWYMDIIGCDTYTLLAVSTKKGHPTFKTVIKRGSPLYIEGKKEYNDILRKYHKLY